MTVDGRKGTLYAELVQPETKAQKNFWVHIRHLSDRYFFLLVTESIIMHEKTIISPTSESIFRFVLL